MILYQDDKRKKGLNGPQMAAALLKDAQLAPVSMGTVVSMTSVFRSVAKTLVIRFGNFVGLHI